MEMAIALRNATAGALIDTPSVWQLAILAALVLIAIMILRLPGLVGEHINSHLDLGKVGNQLEEISRKAGNASDQVEKLDREIQSNVRSNNLQSVIQTLYGAIIGLWGGFFAGWVAEGGPLLVHGQVLRGLLITALSALLVLTLPFTVFRLINRFFAGHGPRPDDLVD